MKLLKKVDYQKLKNSIMKYETQQAILALIIVFLFGYWSYQYYENGKILNNYDLMLVIFMLFSLQSNRKK